MFRSVSHHPSPLEEPSPIPSSDPPETAGPSSLAADVLCLLLDPSHRANRATASDARRSELSFGEMVTVRPRHPSVQSRYPFP